MEGANVSLPSFRYGDITLSNLKGRERQGLHFFFLRENRKS